MLHAAFTFRYPGELNACSFPFPFNGDSDWHEKEMGGVGTWGDDITNSNTCGYFNASSCSFVILFYSKSRIIQFTFMSFLFDVNTSICQHIHHSTVYCIEHSVTSIVGNRSQSFQWWFSLNLWVVYNDTSHRTSMVYCKQSIRTCIHPTMPCRTIVYLYSHMMLFIV
jgi:hypothetical protein